MTECPVRNITEVNCCMYLFLSDRIVVHIKHLKICLCNLYSLELNFYSNIYIFALKHRLGLEDWVYMY